jgi:predicted nucleic acid-binding protein
MVAADQVLGHELVYLEMVLGQGGDTRRELLDDYQRLQTAEALPSREVAVFCRTHRLANRGIGAVDVHLLAAADAHAATVWTLDRAMAEAAASLRLGFVPSDE